MKKISVIILFGLSFSSFAGIFGGGGGSGPLPVVEVGENVKVNAVAKIEQTKATLEAIQQTKNQIIQLKNEATNLHKWAAVALEELTGLSKTDINNLMEIQRLSSSLISDYNNFKKNWRKEFNLDFEKLDINRVISEYGNSEEKIKKINEEMVDFAAKGTERKKNLIKEIGIFSSRNKGALGNMEALQLNNEIGIATYKAIAVLNETLVEQEAKRIEKEALEKKKKEAHNEFRKREYTESTKYREHTSNPIPLKLM